MLEGAAQMESGNFRKLLVTQIFLFLLSQLGKGGTGYGHRDVLPVDTKIAINGIAMPGGDGREQMHKPYLDGRGESSRTDFKGRDDIAHNVTFPGDPG